MRGEEEHAPDWLRAELVDTEGEAGHAWDGVVEELVLLPLRCVLPEKGVQPFEPPVAAVAWVVR